MLITFEDKVFSGICIMKDETKEIFCLKPYHKKNYLVLSNNNYQVVSENKVKQII